jgi:outer membrane immunogenic protein
MRKISSVIAAVSLAVGISQAASAADLPRKAPVMAPPPPPLTWTGCYIGANVGGAWGRFDVDSSLGDLSRNRGGFAGGGQIGCDYQLAGSGLVIGFRNMFDGTTNSVSRSFAFVDPSGGVGTATGE